jgi:hypothetical protein
MRDRVMERFEIERGLRNAFEDGGFEPVRESWKL